MAQTAQLRRIDTAQNEAQRVFKLQRAAYLRHPYPSLEERLANLKKLEEVLVENTDAIAAAINEDFGHRSDEESLMLELFTCVDGLRALGILPHDQNGLAEGRRLFLNAAAVGEDDMRLAHEVDEFLIR